MGCTSSAYDGDFQYDFHDINNDGSWEDDFDQVPKEQYTDDPESSNLKHYTVDFRTSSGLIDHRPRRPEVPPGQMWTDEEFTLPIAIKEYAKQRLDWKRPHEIVRNPVLFADGTSRFDIKQRSFGTCWFLSMMANLGDKPDLCRKVINEDSYTPRTDGICHCRLWRFGEWEDVYMDDYLPVFAGTRQLYGALSGTDTNEMWVSLLEKSLARLHGSYNVVSDEGGYPSDAYLTLTGAVAEKVSFDYDDPDPDQLFRRLRNALHTGALVTCAVPPEFDGEIGLVGGHAYSLTGAYMVTKRDGEKFPLVRIRNPHGTNEWQGKWSDKSSEWGDVSDGHLIRRNKNDGEFWISLEDFLHYFAQTTICSLTPDFDIDGRSDGLNHVLRIFGEWRGGVGQGGTLRDRVRNPRFAFTVPVEGVTDEGYVPVVVQIIQKAHHLDYDAIRCDLYKVTRGSERSRMFYVAKMRDTEAKDCYYPRLQCVFRYRVKPGRYIVIPSTYQSGVNREFLLRVFSSSPVYYCRRVPRQKPIMPLSRY
ncbi:calpain-A-like [Haliotis rufescens]|uniref:calpain-A-like n=1 Tax=Haliotis rufescens TaxID=6454 RepID=UPI00201F641E|nr:calpain-A-like [Haliotis rufescens]